MSAGKAETEFLTAASAAELRPIEVARCVERLMEATGAVDAGRWLAVWIIRFETRIEGRTRREMACEFRDEENSLRAALKGIRHALAGDRVEDAKLLATAAQR